MKPSQTQSPELLDRVYTDARPRPRRRGYWLVNLGGWLVFGAAMMIGWLDVYSWQVVLATTPVYIFIGFCLSLLLWFVYGRLEVGAASFSRALICCIAGSVIAGVLWNAIDTFYRHYGAAFIHSLIIGAPSSISFPRESLLDGALVHGCLPLLGWSLIYLGIHYDTALRKERVTALHAVAIARDAQLRMLAYQLNPHFLFNTLNSIRALINEDRQRAREMVTALSGYLRYALVERPLHVALLEEELAAVRGYLEIEQVRFEERLKVSIDVEPAALNCEVPAFLLNPLVENAVKHGAVGTSEAPLVLRLEARLIGRDRLFLAVENTGHWKASEDVSGEHGRQNSTGGVGLSNVRARLAALYPTEHRMEVEQTTDSVRIRIELPARLRMETAA